MRTFELYPTEQHWWSYADYGTVVDVVRRLGATRVLEFGPGSSTLSLIEGGATHVDTCEDDPHWADVHAERLVSRFPDLVTLHRYTWAQKISMPAIDGQRYDLGLVDAPHATSKRVPVLNYALERCAAVLVPVDRSKGLAQRLAGLTKSPSFTVEIMETGPLAGSFALITRKAPC